MAYLPAARIPRREEGQHLFAICLGTNVLTVFGYVADEEVGMVEHDKILFATPLLAWQQLSPRYVEQLDRHPPGIPDAVKLRVSVAIGQTHHRLPGFTRCGEYALAQCRIEIVDHLDLGFDAAVGLGVGIAQITGVLAVLVHDPDRRLDSVLGHGGFTRGDLFLGRDRAAMLPGVPARGQSPAK